MMIFLEVLKQSAQKVKDTTRFFCGFRMVVVALHFQIPGPPKIFVKGAFTYQMTPLEGEGKQNRHNGVISRRGIRDNVT